MNTMPPNLSFNELISKYAVGGDNWPIDTLVIQSTTITTPLVPAQGALPESIEQSLQS